MKFKIGDKIRANEKSNTWYDCTNQKKQWEGKVIHIIDKLHFDARTTKTNKHKDLGQVFYDLHPDYFEPATKTTQKKIR